MKHLPLIITAVMIVMLGWNLYALAFVPGDTLLDAMFTALFAVLVAFDVRELRKKRRARRG